MNAIQLACATTMHIVAVIAAAALALPAYAQFSVPSDGSDGVLNVTTEDREIDLGLAATGAWDTYGTGNGVYDPDQWIVVFKYQSVNIAPGRTVRFKNHPSNPPVVWLVQGEVRIDGVVSVDGTGNTPWGTAGMYAPGGPGGFRGGRVPTDGVGSGGFGPGATASGPTWNYGNPGCFPLIGGSGGWPYGIPFQGWRYAGGGGGAILIASTQGIMGKGAVRAHGGPDSASGAGGMVRLVAPSVRLRSVSAEGSVGGRIRIEASEISVLEGGPTYSAAPLPSPFVFLRHSLTPSVRVVSVSGLAVSADPASQFAVPGSEVTVSDPQVHVVLECRNVPADATVQVYLRSAVTFDATTVNATFQSGNTALSTWTATGNLGTGPQGFATVQAKATLP